MIICPNCGSTNSEVDGHICRKCGALLPVSSRPPRMKIPFGNKSKEKNEKFEVKKELEVISIDSNSEEEITNYSSEVDLQQIPMTKFDDKIESDINQKTKKIQDEIKNLFYDSREKNKASRLSLEEITPKPFKGSVIARKGVYGPSHDSFKPKPLPLEERRPSISRKSPNGTYEDGFSKTRQLEKDMANVLSVLSLKFKLPQIQEEKLGKETRKPQKEDVTPSNMSEILQELMNIDIKIEASAIIKTDGTILASAISNRISDTLFSTIGQNLSLLGTDIVEGLSAGTLKSISVKGSEGVIDLAPIDPSNKALENMVLIIFSHPKVKSGIINIAVSLLKKKIKSYLGIEE
ncbi:MAG: hypothetical protein P8Y70_07605 [Candidatus Lokiarchaeota archaeon]